jgi:hypothetical protein
MPSPHERLGFEAIAEITVIAPESCGYRACEVCRNEKRPPPLILADMNALMAAPPLMNIIISGKHDVAKRERDSGPGKRNSPEHPGCRSS